MKLGRVFAYGSSFGLFAVAALHGTGYGTISSVVAGAEEDVRAVVPLLWLSFSVDLADIGLIVLVAALRPGRSIRLVVALAGLAPAAAAILQAVFLQFIPPTGMLVALALLTWVAALFLGVKARD